MLVRASIDYLEARYDCRVTKKKLSITPRMVIIMANRNAQKNVFCASETQLSVSREDVAMFDWVGYRKKTKIVT